MHQLPQGPGGRQYAQWAKQYGQTVRVNNKRLSSPAILGDIIHMRVYSSHIVVLNTERAARDLFEGRSNIYSGRAQRTMYSELLGRKHVVLSQQYDERWRKYHRLLTKALSRKAILDFVPAQESASNRLVESLLKTPELFEQHIRTSVEMAKLFFFVTDCNRRYASRVIMQIAYGYDVQGDNDYYIGLVKEGIALGNAGLDSSRWLVDSFPICKSLISVEESS